MATRLLSPLRTWDARRVVRAARRTADAELAATRLPPPRLAWRVAELVADENRVALGRSVADVVHAADERLLPGATPIDRAAIRETRAPLLDLASFLFDTSHAVTARGVLHVERLLADGSGPLYGRRDPELLRSAVRTVRAALEGGP